MYDCTSWDSALVQSFMGNVVIAFKMQGFKNIETWKNNNLKYILFWNKDA